MRKSEYQWGGKGHGDLAAIPVKTDAQIVGDFLDSIRQDNGGILFPKHVVKAAKAKRSPLHKYFTWDDSEAAQQFRITQARALIRSIELVQIEGTTARTRASVSLFTRQVVRQGYENIIDVMKDEDKRKQLLKQAREEAKAWREKYQHLSELAKVFAAIVKL